MLKCLACLCARVPCMLRYSYAIVTCMLMRSRTNISCMLMSQGALHAFMFTCQRVLHTYIAFHTHMPMCLTCITWVLTYITCQHALCAYVITCQCVLQAHKLTCQPSLSLLPHMICVTTWSPANMLCSSGNSLDATVLGFTATAVEVVHTIGKA